MISPTTLSAALDLWSQSGEQHLLPIRGRSMLPIFREGDTVLVAHTRELHPGEIAVFQAPGGLVAHRMLALFGEGEAQVLRAKGDNTLGLDPPVRSGEIVGKAIALRRGDRQMDLDTPAWRSVGKIAAGWLRLQAWVYYRGSGLAPDGRINQPSTLSTWASRALRFGLRAFLWLCQVAFARWRIE